MSLQLDHVTTLTIQLGEQHVIGTTPRGLRRVSPVLSGTAEGPRLGGEVLPGGADWNLVLADGSIEFHARYTIRADDGTLISVTNDGLEREVMAKMFAGQPPDLSRGMYGRTAPKFEVTEGAHGWLNRSLFVAELNLGRKNEAILHVYEVA
jgi:Protein of unknown function (DUF3237)